MICQLLVSKHGEIIIRRPVSGVPGTFVDQVLPDPGFAPGYMEGADPIIHYDNHPVPYQYAVPNQGVNTNFNINPAYPVAVQVPVVTPRFADYSNISPNVLGTIPLGGSGSFVKSDATASANADANTGGEY